VGKTGSLSKRRKKNNSRRDEMYEENSCTHLGQTAKSNTEIAQEITITPILHKIQECRRTCLQNVNRMPRNRFPGIKSDHRPTGRRDQWRTITL
jgi:hypothetical protein